MPISTFKKITVISSFLLVFPLLSFASDIEYAYIDSFNDSEVLINYRGPSTDEYQLCSLSTYSCTPSYEHDISTMNSSSGYLAQSSDGRYAVTYLPLFLSSEPIIYYSLHDISSGTPVFKGLLPFYTIYKTIRFTDDNSALIINTNNGTIFRYDIATGVSTTQNPPVPGLALTSTSADGSFFGGYNYTDAAYYIVNIKTGVTHTIPSSNPSKLAFSNDGLSAFYIDTSTGHKKLWKLDLNTGGTSEIDPGNYVVEDYELGTEGLYFLANKKSAYDWALYRYGWDTAITEISDKASYGEYVYGQNGKIIFAEHNGKNTHITVYDEATATSHALAPKDNPLTESITRQSVAIGNIHGVLLTPTGTTQSEAFIWLHGGPFRQTSLEYHPYLSYAVYDELLEKMAAAGYPVLKLDYTGSWGYSEEYKNSLLNSIGIKDVTDVMNATDYLREEVGSSKINLIGNSYGGYLALKAVADHPAELGGAISINGVTDWFSLIDTIPSSIFSTHFDVRDNVPTATAGITKDNIGLYYNASIFTKVPTLDNDPILVVYGQEDDQVPIWQSERFYWLGYASGKNVKRLVFPDEGHIIKKRENLNSLCSSVTNTFNLTGISCN